VLGWHAGARPTTNKVLDVLEVIARTGTRETIATPRRPQGCRPAA
jgi:hypothetical protein